MQTIDIIRPQSTVATTRAAILVRLQQAIRLITDLGIDPDPYCLGRIREVYEIFDAEDRAGRDTTSELAILNVNISMMIDKAYSTAQ